MTLPHTLATFEEQLVAAGHSVVQHWNAGLAEGTARDWLTAAGLTTVPELLALYAWKNGQAYEHVPSGRLRFGSPGVFYPLDVALQEYALSQAEGFYAPHFFPVCSDDALLLHLDPQSAGYGGLYLYSPSLLVLEPERMYDSLPAMVNTFAACFAQGVYGYDADGYFAYDQDAEWALSKALNPHASYWDNNSLI